jgi:transcriptional regulator with XRE-family HTH domain
MASRRPPQRAPKPGRLTPWETIGSRIRGYREQAGFDQSDLAYEIFTSATNLSRIERGHREPHDDLIGLIIRALRGPNANPKVYVTLADFKSNTGYDVEVRITGTRAKGEVDADSMAALAAAIAAA